MRAIGLLSVLALLPLAAAEDGCDSFFMEPSGAHEVGPDAGMVPVRVIAPIGCTYETNALGSSWLTPVPAIFTVEETEERFDVLYDANDQVEERRGSITLRSTNQTLYLDIHQRAPPPPPGEEPSPELLEEGELDVDGGGALAALAPLTLVALTRRRR